MPHVPRKKLFRPLVVLQAALRERRGRREKQQCYCDGTATADRSHHVGFPQRSITKNAFAGTTPFVASSECILISSEPSNNSQNSKFARSSIARAPLFVEPV